MARHTLSLSLFLLAFLTLLGLGFWQVERQEWKDSIITALQHEYQKDPDKNIYLFKELKALNQEELPLRYGQSLGRFFYDREILLGPKTSNDTIGYLIITPLKLRNGGYVLVNRGWIAQSNIDKIRQDDQKGNVTVTGIFRKPDWNYFTPGNSPQNDIWMKPDIHDIARAKSLKPIAPVILYATTNEDQPDQMALIQPQSAKWYPRNKHKQYAVFWFAMAIILVIFLGAFVFEEKRKRKTKA